MNQSSIKSSPFQKIHENTMPMKSIFCIPLSIPWKNHHKNTLEIPTETQHHRGPAVQALLEKTRRSATVRAVTQVEAETDFMASSGPLVMTFTGLAMGF